MSRDTWAVALKSGKQVDEGSQVLLEARQMQVIFDDKKTVQCAICHLMEVFAKVKIDDCGGQETLCQKPALAQVLKS